MSRDEILPSLLSINTDYKEICTYQKHISLYLNHAYDSWWSPITWKYSRCDYRNRKRIDCDHITHNMCVPAYLDSGLFQLVSCIIWAYLTQFLTATHTNHDIGVPSQKLFSVDMKIDTYIENNVRCEEHTYYISCNCISYA